MNSIILKIGPAQPLPPKKLPNLHNFRPMLKFCLEVTYGAIQLNQSTKVNIWSAVPWTCFSFFIPDFLIVSRAAAPEGQCPVKYFVQPFIRPSCLFPLTWRLWLGALPSRCCPGGPALETLSWKPWLGSHSLEASRVSRLGLPSQGFQDRVWGPWPAWPGEPGLGAQGATDVWTMYVQTKYPLYSTGQSPSGDAAQKGTYGVSSTWLSHPLALPKTTPTIKFVNFETWWGLI